MMQKKPVYYRLGLRHIELSSVHWPLRLLGSVSRTSSCGSLIEQLRCRDYWSIQPIVTMRNMGSIMSKGKHHSQVSFNTRHSAGYRSSWGHPATPYTIHTCTCLYIV